MIFWGHKTDAWFDVWSLEHFFSGLSITAITIFLIHRYILTPEDKIKNPHYIYLIGVLLAAYVWEAIEFYLEAGYTNIDVVTHWFQGVEFWGNRLIGDPLVTVLGGWVALNYKKMIWPARVFSLVWLLVHIFVFPHSMYLHDIF